MISPVAVGCSGSVKCMRIGECMEMERVGAFFMAPCYWSDVRARRRHQLGDTNGVVTPRGLHWCARVLECAGNPK